MTTPGQAKPSLALEAIGISKRFGSVVALDDVSLRVRRGRIHALLGENGAGKSTLLKCLMGYYRADNGQFLVDGREHESRNARAAQSAGLAMVYQHFTLVPGMSVAENLMLARPDVPFVVDWQAYRRDLGHLLEGMPFRIRLDAEVSTLAAGEKQKVEIIKRLAARPKLLVLDEPTSVLTPQEADEVLGALRALVRTGNLTVIMITHKFREVLAFADDVTVLRRGRKVVDAEADALDAESLAMHMVGTEALAPAVTRTPAAANRNRLDVRGLRVIGDQRIARVDDLNFSVRGGEIVGIAGVSGNGQRELVEAIAGQRAIAGGEIIVHGAPYRPTRRAIQAARLSCLPEEPLSNACVAGMSVADNLILRRYDLPPVRRWGGFLSRRFILRYAKDAIAPFRIKTGGPLAPARSLSGGNLQRLVLAREFGDDCRILIASNPCFGLDFSAVARIHDEIMRMRNRGAAVLLVTEDLDEIFELADRIAVMFEGRIVLETAPDPAKRMAIGRAMAGAVAGAGE